MVGILLCSVHKQFIIIIDYLIIIVIQVTLHKNKQKLVYYE